MLSDIGYHIRGFSQFNRADKPKLRDVVSVFGKHGGGLFQTTGGFDQVPTKNRLACYDYRP